MLYNKQEPKKCVFCGTEFDTPYKRQIYCSEYCKIKANSENQRYKPKYRKPAHNKFEEGFKEYTDFCEKHGRISWGEWSYLQGRGKV